MNRLVCLNILPYFILQIVEVCEICVGQILLLHFVPRYYCLSTGHFLLCFSLKRCAFRLLLKQILLKNNLCIPPKFIGKKVSISFMIEFDERSTAVFLIFHFAGKGLQLVHELYG